MQTSNRLLDDLAKVANGAVSTLVGVKDEIEALVRQRVPPHRPHHGAGSWAGAKPRDLLPFRTTSVRQRVCSLARPLRGGHRPRSRRRSGSGRAPSWRRVVAAPSPRPGSILGGWRRTRARTRARTTRSSVTIAAAGRAWHHGLKSRERMCGLACRARKDVRPKVTIKTWRW